MYPFLCCGSFLTVLIKSLLVTSVSETLSGTHLGNFSYLENLSNLL